MFWYVNREDLQLPTALLVCSPTPLGRPLGAQSRYLIARPRIQTWNKGRFPNGKLLSPFFCPNYCISKIYLTDTELRVRTISHFFLPVASYNLCVTAIKTKCQIVESVQNMSIYTVYIDIFCTLSIIWHFVSKTVTNNWLLRPPVQRKTKMKRFSYDKRLCSQNYRYYR